MTCPDCERNKYRAALWRAEAYRLGGHDIIERPWKSLTKEEARAIWSSCIGYPDPTDDELDIVWKIDKYLKEKNV